MKPLKPLVILLLVSVLTSTDMQAQTNYDESKVPSYTLPDPLISTNGNKIQSIEDWEDLRRPEIIALFEEEVYGKMPGEISLSSHRILEESDQALGNSAIRKQVELNFQQNGKSLSLQMLIYLPKGVQHPPLFVGLNFLGNHTINADKEILLTNSWIPNNTLGMTENKANDISRGKRTNRWSVDEILAAGYGLATIYYGDIDPDRNDFSDGPHPLLYKENQTKPQANEWGAIAAWAWGLSRAMDYFEKDEDIDASNIVLMGHSRIGKAALWAGALDQRFALVISNDSGCGGAAISRRKYGETLDIINTSFPHWFNTNFKKYNFKEETQAIDQHLLLSLIAPRPLYIASAIEDQWADPKGEFLGGFHASSVYNLYGKTGLENEEMPEINQPIQHDIGYHIRDGIHDVTTYDWQQFISFANKHLK